MRGTVFCTHTGHQRGRSSSFLRILYVSTQRRRHYACFRLHGPDHHTHRSWTRRLLSGLVAAAGIFLLYFWSARPPNTPPRAPDASLGGTKGPTGIQSTLNGLSSSSPSSLTVTRNHGPTMSAVAVPSSPPCTDRLEHDRGIGGGGAWRMGGFLGVVSPSKDGLVAPVLTHLYRVKRLSLSRASNLCPIAAAYVREHPI